MKQNHDRPEFFTTTTITIVSLQNTSSFLLIVMSND
jgi:hypothetical protein